jgi:anion-transporting  ArsA/GET3 family ATPase
VTFPSLARVTVVAGKGGVGKTTVTAALAWMAASAGVDTLVVEVEGKSGLPELFGQRGPLGYEETVMLPAGGAGPGSAQVRARTITPDEALVEYLEAHGMNRIARRLSSSGTLEVVATAVPGIKEILVLGKVKSLEVASRAMGTPGLILVDSPAAGHAVTFLASAHGLLDAAGVGPIRTQAAEVVEMLGNPERCEVVLVTIPEETPVNEAIDTAFHLEDKAGVQLGPIVVNCVWPQLEIPAAVAEGHPTGDGGSPFTGLSPTQVEVLQSAARFRLRRQALQEAQMARLAEGLPLPQLHVPFLFKTELGPAEVAELAATMWRQWAAIAA